MPPGIANVSNDQVACEGSLVTLSCNATGKPTPNISWTKVEDNGTDSAPLLPAMDGKYVMSNIQRSVNGTYRCTADNGVGAPVNRTVRVKVECKSRTFYVVSKKRRKVVWKKTTVTLVLNSVKKRESENMIKILRHFAQPWDTGLLYRYLWSIPLI